MDPRDILPTHLLAAGTALMHARPWHDSPVTLDSPALAVMTDLTQVKAATTDPASSLLQAEQAMVYLGVRMLFVLSQMPRLEGLITSTDLHGDKPMRVVNQRGIRHDDLCVADVMTPLSMLDALDMDVMRTARVSNLIATLKAQGRNHLLVIGDGPGARQVRGVISRTQIERQLGMSIEIADVAGNFAELGQLLSHS